jgi:hypothetical protein
MESFCAIQTDSEALLLHEIEDKQALFRIRYLQPCFNVFRNAERMEYAAAIGSNPN